MKIEEYNIVQEKIKDSKRNLPSLVEELHLRIMVGSAATCIIAEAYGNKPIAYTAFGIFALSVAPWFYGLYKDTKNKN